MAMNRDGMLLTIIAVFFALVGGMLAVSISVRCAQERVEVAHRSAEVQGREWCLGGLVLQPGGHLHCGEWTITRGKDRSCRAHGPLGDYVIAADGQGQWRNAGWR